MCVWLCFFFSLAPDQCSPAWLQLSCNYTAVCDVRLLKRSNTVSILSWGIDLRGLIHCHERSLAVFWCHTIVFFLFYFMPVFLSSSVLCFIFTYGERASKMSLALRGDYWAENSRRNKPRRWDKHASKQTRKTEEKRKNDEQKVKIRRLIWNNLLPRGNNHQSYSSSPQMHWTDVFHTFMQGYWL